MEINANNAIVTGASRGIGKQIALELASRGLNVALIARNEKALAETAREIERFDVQALPLALDISDKKQIGIAFKKVFKKFGSIDILINNAGINSRKKFHELKESDWSKEIDTNLSAVFFCSKEAARFMKHNRKSWIVNISSIKGREATSSMAYGASKAGVIGLTKCMAKQLIKDNIFVNCVAPGFIDCGMTKQLSNEELEKYLKTIPLGRIGKPEEIARVVAFLCSEEATYIVGATIDVNGGYLMT